jgi:cbb3-type cytochrome oxidase maturation protein
VELILVLLPFALLFAGIALALFVWAARSGQFDDLDTPAVRILFEDETPVPAHGPAAPASPAARNRRAATSGPARGADDPDKERP